MTSKLEAYLTPNLAYRDKIFDNKQGGFLSAFFPNGIEFSGRKALGKSVPAWGFE